MTDWLKEHYLYIIGPIGAALAVNLFFAIVMRLSIGRRMNMKDWPQPRE